MAQTRQVASLLQQLYPQVEVLVIEVSSTGDESLGTPLHKFSEVGVFVKSLERALLDDKADCALHCLKDMPEPIDKEFALVAYLKREQVADVLITKKGVQAGMLKQVATGSLRRRSFLKQGFPNWTFTELRGNINTRIRKVLSGEVEATILAQVGIERLRLELEQHSDFFNDLSQLDITPLPLELLPPAPGQGCLVLQCLQDRREKIHELTKMLSALNDPVTEFVVGLERNIMHLVEGGCRTPLGVWARVEKDNLKILAKMEKPNILNPSSVASAQIESIAKVVTVDKEIKGIGKVASNDMGINQNNLANTVNVTKLAKEISAALLENNQ